MGTRVLFQLKDGINLGGSYVISGTGVPGSTGGLPDSAPKGSRYTDKATGHAWLKLTTGTGTDKWTRLQTQEDMAAAMQGTSWRDPVKVRDASVYADKAAAETALNTGTINAI